MYIQTLYQAYLHKEYPNVIYTKDVRNSGCQTQSMLMRDPALATLTNVIGSEDKDLYSDVFFNMKTLIEDIFQECVLFFKHVFDYDFTALEKSSDPFSKKLSQLLSMTTLKTFKDHFYNVFLSFLADNHFKLSKRYHLAEAFKMEQPHIYLVKKIRKPVSYL